MLKTVGASGQLSLGKKLAGQHFEMEQRPDGSILLVPVTVSRTGGPAGDKAAGHPDNKAGPAQAPGKSKPRFHVFKVEHFDLPTREEIHRRGAVR